MMPILRIWSLLETIFRMSVELLKGGNEFYLSSLRDSAKPNSALLYIAPEWSRIGLRKLGRFRYPMVSANSCDSHSDYVPMRHPQIFRDPMLPGDMNWS